MQGSAFIIKIKVSVHTNNKNHWKTEKTHNIGSRKTQSNDYLHGILILNKVLNIHAILFNKYQP